MTAIKRWGGLVVGLIVMAFHITINWRALMAEEENSEWD